MSLSRDVNLSIISVGDFLDFNYAAAFSRNLGWVTQEEQQLIKQKRIAIAGLGGVGGSHLITLSRLGFENFHIADFDHFEIHNFNRQAGAFVSKLGKAKIEVMAEMAKDINSDMKIKQFSAGVTKDNVIEFLTGVDLYLDGLDFFAFEVRELIFKTANELGIPCVTAGPLGMGASLVNFLPGKMTFDQYFGLSMAKNDEEKSILFSIGLSPKRIQTSYLRDLTRVDFKNRKVPSTVMGCMMCSSIACTEILKILLGRGPVSCAPVAIQFDGYLNKVVRSYVPFGFKNPLQKIRFYIGKFILSQRLKSS